MPIRCNIPSLLRRLVFQVKQNDRPRDKLLFRKYQVAPRTTAAVLRGRLRSRLKRAAEPSGSERIARTSANTFSKVVQHSLPQPKTVWQAELSSR